jgi:hypothetical protein
MTENIQTLMQNGRLWRGLEHDFHRPLDDKLGLATGYETLDHALPFGGWPRGALTEILYSWPGQGELQLLLPALTRVSRQQRYIVLIDPPWLPYAPALAAAGIDLSFVISIDRLDENDRHWALEQTLRAGQCGAALAWPREDLDGKTLRRLQLAAEAGDSCGFLYRHPRFRPQHSPAALRLQLHPAETGLQLELVKCRGRNPSATRIELPLANGRI